MSSIKKLIEETSRHATKEFSDGLKELDSLVELEDVKEDIVRQIRFLISRPKYQNGLYRLNTVFYGPPGVGKSETAKIIAKIIASMEIISQKEGISDHDIIINQASHGITLVSKNEKSLEEENVEIPDMNEEHFERTDSSEHLSEIPKKKTDNIDEIRNCFLNILVSAKQSNTFTRKPLEGICICGREHFVGEYVGHTGPKTQAFLLANANKIIIIEEAYLLYSGERDSFGMEALTGILRFTDEHPTPIFFTGYKDLMEETIFKAQPGLKRRIHWYFNLSGYSPKGLAKIFKIQLEKKNATISKDLNLEKFFSDNYKDFPSFGGDTERLVFHCLMYHIENKDIYARHECVINKKDLETGLLALRKNKMSEHLEENHLNIYA